MNKSNLKRKLHSIIFESETQAGRNFDLLLILLILLSVFTVILESVPRYRENYGDYFFYIEWGLTFVFVLEYLLRIYSVDKPVRYIFSFFGLIDLLSCLPMILSLFFAGTQSLLVVRALRLLRIFRILKLGWYFSEGVVILDALKASRARITVFLLSVIVIVIVAGTSMYLIEGSNSGFNSIPSSMYWAIVTLTTVGYGDIAPATTLGRFVASLIMILGYAIIAVPTGIVTSELTKTHLLRKVSHRTCPSCADQDHEEKALYCKLCGEKLG